MTGSDRSAVLARVAEAVAPRARQHTAWERVWGAERTRQRGQGPPTAEEGRRGPRPAPRNTWSHRERAQRVARAARPEFGHASPHQSVPRLAARGESRAADSSVDRMLKTHALLAQRGRATPVHWARPRA